MKICRLCKSLPSVHQNLNQECVCRGQYLEETQPSALALNWEKTKTAPPHFWRYQGILPELKPENRIEFQEGMTPLTSIELSGKKVWIKLEHLLPTGSYKDRGTAVMLSVLKDLGIKEVVEDSSGNAGASVAAYAARGGLKAKIFVPENTSISKIGQIQAYGAEVVKVSGSRADCENAAVAAARKSFYASHVRFSTFSTGTQTFILEVFEQFNQNLPEVLFLPLGNGSLLLGVYKGLMHLKAQGYITTYPKIIAVQAANCAPIYHRWKEQVPEKAQPTLAEGIAVDRPFLLSPILEVLKALKGEVMTVDEGALKSALKQVWQKGFLIEPTSAAVFAAMEKCLSTGDELSAKSWLSLTSGNGLKTGFGTQSR